MPDIEIFVHVPGVVVDGSLPLRDGWALAPLAFERWQELDRWVIHPRRRRNFVRAQPTFLTGKVAGAAATSGIGSIGGSVLAPIKRLAHDTQRAISLATQAALMSPEVSVAYADWGHGSVYRSLGLAEREAVTGADHAVHLDATQLRQLHAALGMVERYRRAGALAEIEQGFDRLSDGALPDFQPVDGVVHHLIALEGLLLPDVRSGVTAAFVQRGAALLADSDLEVEPTRQALSEAYALRSDLLHGRDADAAISRSGRSIGSWKKWSRSALCNALMRTLSGLQGHPGGHLAALAQFRTELQCAAASGQRWVGPDPTSEPATS